MGPIWRQLHANEQRKETSSVQGGSSKLHSILEQGFDIMMMWPSIRPWPEINLRAWQLARQTPPVAGDTSLYSW